MKKIYLDWNVINHIEESPQLYDYIRQNQVHFVFVYSPAHFSDLMKSYTEDGSNKYFEKDLQRLETVCETHLIRHCDKKIDIHCCPPREFLEKEGKNYPVSKYLLHFNELKKSMKIGELDKNSVTEKISATASDGKKYLTSFYSLDAIISVGYRVSSARATKFRQWATRILNEYMHTTNQRITPLPSQNPPI